MSLLLKYLAIKDPADNTASGTAVLSNIMDGVDGAALFGFTVENESVQIEDMQTLDHSSTGTLDVKVLKNVPTEGLLNGLIGDRVEVSGIGIDGFLLWDENPIFSRVPDFNSAILNDHITTTVKSIKGYAGASQRFYGGRNALALYDLSTGGTNLLNGFNTSGAATATRSNEVQTVEVTAEAGGVASNKFLMPFVGETLYTSIDVTVSGAFTVQILFYDHDDNFLSAASSAITGTGRQGVSGVIPSDTCYVRMGVVSTSEDENMSFRWPVLATTPHTGNVL